jgi:hypothetical protein
LILAGQLVRPDEVRLLIERLEQTPLSSKLRDALSEDPKMIVALSIQERVQILAALDDQPERLRPLKATLLAQFKNRERRAAEARATDEEPDPTPE